MSNVITTNSTDIPLREKQVIFDTTKALMSIDVADTRIPLTGEYTAMEVYAHDFDITAGTVDDVTGLTYNYDVPASLTHRMRVRTGGSDNTKSDVVVDWGDGQVSAIAKGEYYYADGASSQDYVMEHTYAATGRYIIKIYGKDYYSVCTPPSNMEPTKYYLLSRILEADLPVASNFTNFSSLCRYAYRLQKIAASDYHKSFTAVRNIANMCDTCVNLVSVTGLANQFLIVSAASNIFKNCYSLSTLDFTLPAVVTGGAMNNALQNCVALSTTVQSLIPAGGFIGRLNIHDLFNNMRLLSGTLPAELLWNSDQVTWTDTTQVFWGAVPDEVRAQAPVSWGGTASDDIINSGSSSGGALEDVIADPEGMACEIDRVEGGKRYLCRVNPDGTEDKTTHGIDHLYVASVEHSPLESEIWFYVMESEMGGITLPANVGWIGEPDIEGGKFYIISIRNSVAVCAEYTPGVTA